LRWHPLASPSREWTPPFRLPSRRTLSWNQKIMLTPLRYVLLDVVTCTLIPVGLCLIGIRKL
jgi:hypothetical protein